MKMWFNRMLQDRQEILVLGELVLFLAAWGLGLAAAVDDYRVRTNAKAANNVAAKTVAAKSNIAAGFDFSGANHSRPVPAGVSPAGVSPAGVTPVGTIAIDPGFLDQQGEFE